MGSHEYEFAVTAKVLAAIPQGKMGYQADGKARTAGDLAWHIAVAEKVFLEGILAGEFAWDESGKPEGDSGEAIAAWYSATIPGLVAKLKALDGAALTRTIPFFGMFNLPAAAYLNFMLNHTIHHRGQLAAALRPMGGKVPSIYGGSADEPFEG
jgi:uncharacterized damage-inducible protein DinB